MNVIEPGSPVLPLRLHLSTYLPIKTLLVPLRRHFENLSLLKSVEDDSRSFNNMGEEIFRKLHVHYPIRDLLISVEDGLDIRVVPKDLWERALRLSTEQVDVGGWKGRLGLDK